MWIHKLIWVQTEAVDASNQIGPALPTFCANIFKFYFLSIYSKQ